MIYNAIGTLTLTNDLEGVVFKGVILRDARSVGEDMNAFNFEKSGGGSFVKAGCW